MNHQILYWSIPIVDQSQTKWCVPEHVFISYLSSEPRSSWFGIRHWSQCVEVMRFCSLSLSVRLSLRPPSVLEALLSSVPSWPYLLPLCFDSSLAQGKPLHSSAAGKICSEQYNRSLRSVLSRSKLTALFTFILRTALNQNREAQTHTMCLWCAKKRNWIHLCLLSIVFGTGAILYYSHRSLLNNLDEGRQAEQSQCQSFIWPGCLFHAKVFCLHKNFAGLHSTSARITEEQVQLHCLRLWASYCMCVVVSYQINSL